MSSLHSLMRSANPVLDPVIDIDDAEIDLLLALTMTRSTEMDAKELTKPVHEAPTERPNRWWAAAAAFAFVLLIVGGALVLFTARDDAPVTTPDPTPTTSAQQDPTPTTAPLVVEEPEPDTGPVMTPTMEAFIVAYQETFNSGDVDAFEALFDPGATRVDPYTPELPVALDQLVFEMENLTAQETMVTLEDCVAKASGVSCSTVRSGPVHDALGTGSLVSRDLYILDEAGRLLGIQMGAHNNDSRGDNAFRDWLKATHPDVHAELTTPAEFGLHQLFAYADAPIYLEWAPVWAELGRPTP